MRDPFSRQSTPRLVAMLAILVAIGAMVWFLGVVSSYERSIISRTRSEIAALHSHGPLTAHDVGLIRAWMTFDYLNDIFALPPQYLQQTLSITDSQYPRLSIAHAARDENLTNADMASRVRVAVEQYFASSTTR